MESGEMERSDSLDSDSVRVEMTSPISLCCKLSNDPTRTQSPV